MAKYEVNGQVYEFPDEMSEADVLNIISTNEPQAFQPTPLTGNPELDRKIEFGNQMENKAETQSPFVGSGIPGMAFPPTSQDQMLDVLGVPNDAPQQEAPAPQAVAQKEEKPYGGLFTPVEPQYEDVTTQEMSTDALGNPTGMDFEQTTRVRKFIPPQELPKNPDWMKASEMLYQALNAGKKFEGTPEELADYGVSVAQWFNNNLTIGGTQLAYQMAQMPPEQRQAFLYLLDTYDNVDLSPENAVRAIGYQAIDPLNIIGLGTIMASLGGGSAVVQGGKVVAKETLKAIIRNPAFIAGVDTAIYGGGRDLLDQSVEVLGGRQEAIDPMQVGESAALTGAVGAGAGGLLGMTSRILAREATPKVKPKLPKIELEAELPKPTNLKPELEEAVSQFEKGLKEELAKEAPLSPELNDALKVFEDKLKAELANGETFDQAANRVLESFKPSHADDAPDVAATTNKVDTIKDQISGVDTPTRQALNEANPPKPQVSDGVRELLDRVPDFTEYSMSYVRKAIKPVLDEFLEIAKLGPEELDRAISYKLVDTERSKLMAIVTSAAARTERAINDLRDELTILINQPVTDAALIEAKEAERKALLDQLQNIQILQSPVGTEAGRLMKLAQIATALNKENRVDVAKLRALGVTDDDLAKMIADASDSVSKKELYNLYAERNEAMKSQNREEVAKIDAKIDKVLDNLQLASEVAKDSTLKKLVGVIVEMRTTSLISSTGTVVRNLVGGGLHKILDRSSEIVGLLGLEDGYKYIAAQRVGRSIAMKAGFKGQMAALGDLFKNSVKEAASERTLLNVGDLGDRNIRKISSTALGLDPNSATGKLIDVAGRVWRAQTIPMVVSDEMLGGIFARAEIGEQAGFDFIRLLAKKREIVQAKLRDPNLDGVRKRALQGELRELNDFRNAKVNGKSLNDFIEAKVASTIDQTGRITDEAVLERVNYLLLRNKPTGAISQGIESFANMGGGAARLFQPFVRTPINEFKRTLEYIPLTQNMKFMHDLGTDLASKDPRVVARAKGKFIVGWAVASTALYAAYEGISTGSGPRAKDDRLTNEAAGVMAPKSLNMFGVHVDISGIGPLANVFIAATNIAQETERQWRDIENMQAIGDTEGAAIKMTQFEEFKQKSFAVMYAYVAAIGNAILDTGTMEAPKSVIDGVNTLIKSSDDNETLQKALDKQAEKYVTSMVPAVMKEMSNAIDPTKVDPNGVIQSLEAAFGIKKSQTIVRDALGFPIENKTPYRAILGTFGPQNLKEADNVVQIVRNNLEFLRQMTGRSFILETSPPEIGKLDLSKLPAKTGGRSVYDVYADNLQQVKLAGTGGKSQTLAEALYEVIGNRERLNRSVGNTEYKGQLFEDISAVMNRYKKAAWFKTKNEERFNEDFVKEFNWRYDLQNAAKNPNMDIAPPNIRIPFQ